MKTLSTLLLITILAASAGAQTPKRYTPADGAVDAGLAGAMLADELTSWQVKNRCPTCREAGLPTAGRLALKGSIFALVEFVRYRHPEKRKLFWGVELGLAAVYGWAAYHNNHVGR